MNHVVIIDPFVIDLGEKVIYGPYEEDRIPVSFYSAVMERYDDPDMMAYEIPIGTNMFIDPWDDTRWISKIVFINGYVYVQR